MVLRPSRRQILAGARASALAASASPLPGHPVMARSVVYEDRRGCGARRPRDRGIAGVMVSNGRDVAVTGPGGEWALPVEPGESLFVIKPPQWTTRTSAAGVPQFSYLYQPEGSPADLGARFPLILPTGPLPRSIDFPLQPRTEARDFEAFLATDTQPESLAELSYVRDDIVAMMLSVGGAEFGINHGDVVADDLSLYPRYLSLLGATGIPWHHCSGNHDINSAARDDRFSRETWKPSGRAGTPSSTARPHFSCSTTWSTWAGGAIAARSGRGSSPSCATCWSACRRRPEDTRDPRGRW